VKEINLISQDTINYGVDLGLRQGLVQLLRELVKVDGIRWIRPFYLYPQHVTEDLLDLYAGEDRITKYMDMPLQHINDRLLKRMHRLGDRAAIESLVDRIRSRIPGISFRTAFVVGFPGETDKAFDELYEFVERSQFDRVAVFLYSDEEGTGAMSLDQKVDREVMEDRRNALLSLQESIAAAKGRAKIGSILDVLVDGRSQESEGVLEGRHEGLAPEIDGVVYIDEEATAATLQSASERTVPLLTTGTFCKIKITDAAAFDLVGRLETDPVS
jgi:ribosomal protein S12 methylthiotransferase